MQMAGESVNALNHESSGQSPLSWLKALAERWTKSIFIMPAVLALLFLSIFPLIISFYLSLTRFRFVRGGFELKFIGLENYEALLVGHDQSRFLGVLGETTALVWIILAGLV